MVLKNGVTRVTNIETVGYNGTHMNCPNYWTKFCTLKPWISQQSMIKLNSQNDNFNQFEFNKEFYGAEDKYFCHYLGPRFIKLLYGLDFNYDTTSLSPIKCMKTCKISFFFIFRTTVYRKTIHYWEIRAPYLRLGLHGSGHSSDAGTVGAWGATGPPNILQIS